LSVSKKWATESGPQYSSTANTNQFDFYIVTEAAALLDASKSDHFDYIENTSAAYTDTAVAFGKWI